MSHSKESVLPIIDFGPFIIPGYKCSTKEEVIKQLSQACETLGCFYLKHHGIDDQLIRNLISDYRSFYAQPLDYKRKYVDPLGNPHRGFVEFEKQNVNQFMGRKGLPNDPLEKYLLSPPESNLSLVDENLWPDHPPTLKANIEKYYSSMKDLAENLMDVLSQALNVPGYEKFLYSRCCNAEHRLKNHLYPPNSEKKPMQHTQLPEHTDASPFALLLTDACPGSLQVFHDKVQKWISVPPKEGMFMMNLGDPVARWTNDHWKSPLHKVVWPEERSNIGRMSLVFFAYANNDATMESIPAFLKEGEKAKYDAIRYDKFIENKFKHHSY